MAYACSRVIGAKAATHGDQPPGSTRCNGGLSVTPEGIIAAIFGGLGILAANFVLTLRNSKTHREEAQKTRQATVTATNDQTTKIVDAFTQQQTTTRELMQMVIDSRDSTIRDLQADIRVLQQASANFKALSETQAAEIEKQRKEIGTLNASLAALQQKQQQQAAESQKLINHLNETIKAKDDQIARLTTQLTEAQTELQSKLADMAKLQQQVDELKKSMADLQRQIDELRLSLAEKDRQIEQLRQERDEALARATRAERERDEAKALAAEWQQRATDKLPELTGEQAAKLDGAE